ncbi:MAG: adenine deaminase [Planctomycetota bacterium]|jgi:adenine deaminase
MADPKDLIDVALSRKSADLVIRNVKLVNVFTGDIEEGVDLAVAGDTIAGIGKYEAAAEVIDGEGLFASPAFLDGHIHLESSLLTPDQFASAVVPRGTAATVCDPHEIANVAGLEGLRYIVEAGRSLPLDVLITAPSCVPATRLETSGADLGVAEIREVLSWPECVGLGEMMNFPGLLGGAPDVLAKLDAASGRHVDGHAPGVGGPSLDAYIAAGPSTDHESTTLSEGRQKLARGLTLMIREGSSERNLAALAPLVTEHTFHRCVLVSDDRAALDLRDQGHMDHALRRAVEESIPPVRAITMASWNTAQVFGLARRGAVAPGFLADVVLFSDLTKIDVRRVFHHGREVARDGALLRPPAAPLPGPRDTVKIGALKPEGLRIPAAEGKALAIELVPGQIITKKIEVDAPSRDGAWTSDPAIDLLKLVVVERHRGSGRVTAALVRGFGLKEGAIASSVAHDSHNLIASGVSDADILAALEAVAGAGGGLAYAAGGTAREILPLPVAGLLSDRSLAEVCDGLGRLRRCVGEGGGVLEAPFAALSFLALPVIPELRLTDFGLVDVMKQEVVG